MMRVEKIEHCLCHDAAIVNKAAYMVVGIDLEGHIPRLTSSSVTVAPVPPVAPSTIAFFNRITSLIFLFIDQLLT
jgi:hypothetical protein